LAGPVYDYGGAAGVLANGLFSSKSGGIVVQLRDVMTRDVQVVDPDASLQEAAQKMSSDVGPLPVSDGTRLFGVVTDRDIMVRGVAEGRDPNRTRVRDVMTADVHFCFDDDDVLEAARLMEQNHMGRVLVLDRRKNLVGVVSLEDLPLSAGRETRVEEQKERFKQGESTMAVSRTGSLAGSEKYQPAPRNMTGRNTVAGLFRERQSAERAIDDLKEAGFKGEQIGIVMRDPSEGGRITERRESDRGSGSHATSGAVTGVVGGGLLGGLAGYLVAIGALTIPGIGPVLAGGAIAQALGLGVIGTTAAVGAGIGAAAGGLVGALVGLGIPEEEARYFEKGLGTEEVLVTVKAGDRVMEALAILETNDADTGLGRAPRVH
jgi:CBS domain-containing protein